MTITVHGDDLNLKSAAWDHLLSQHGLESSATMHGWVRKSHWYGSEQDIRGYVGNAFQSFKAWASGREVTLNQDVNNRTVVDIEIDETVGTGTNGEPTKRVRLVMEINHSGDCALVTAFPL